MPPAVRVPAPPPVAGAPPGSRRVPAPRPLPADATGRQGSGAAARGVGPVATGLTGVSADPGVCIAESTATTSAAGHHQRLTERRDRRGTAPSGTAGLRVSRRSTIAAAPDSARSADAGGRRSAFTTDGY